MLLFRPKQEFDDFIVDQTRCQNQNVFIDVNDCLNENLVIMEEEDPILNWQAVKVASDEFVDGLEREFGKAFFLNCEVVVKIFIGYNKVDVLRLKDWVVEVDRDFRGFVVDFDEFSFEKIGGGGWEHRGVDWLDVSFS